MIKQLLNFLIFQFIFMADGDGDGGGGGGAGSFMGGAGGEKEGEKAGEKEGEKAGEKEDITYKYPEGLDKSFHGNPSLLKFANDKGEFNQADIMKGLIHATATIGADKMLVPTKNFTEEQMTEAYQKMGVPKEIADYKVVNNLPEGVKANETMLTEFTNLAHKLGVHPKQAQGLLDFYNTFSQNQMTEQNKGYVTERDNDIAALKVEWGTGYDKNMNMAEQALKHFYPDEAARKAVTDTGFLDTVEGTKFFKMLGSNLSEEVFTPEGQGGFGDSAQELDNKIGAVHAELTKIGRQGPTYHGKLNEYNALLSKRWGTAKVNESSAPRG